MNMEKCCSGLLRRDVLVPLRSGIPRGTASRIASAADSQLTALCRGMVLTERWEKVDRAKGGEVHS